jgi:hypothetical protein
MTITDTDLRVKALERATTVFTPREEALATAQEFYDFLAGEQAPVTVGEIEADGEECDICNWEASAGRSVTDDEMDAYWDSGVLPELPFQQEELAFDQEEQASAALKAILDALASSLEAEEIDPEDDPNVLAKVYFTKEALGHLLTIVSGFIVMATNSGVPQTEPTFAYALETMDNILHTLGVEPEDLDAGLSINDLINKGE